ncbi:MAG: outer membrane beta-barrel protein [Cyclobacteriaceae bacterium]|nr:outer membrane beta-barrel protein [Cyclobacteriaceae bacterium]
MNGQTKVSGSIYDQSNEPIPYVNILVLNNSDSSIVSGVVSDVQGNFSVPFLENQHIAIKMIGFEYLILNLKSEGKSVDVGKVILKESVTKLDELVVSGQKMLYESQLDRLVINVDGNINSEGKSVISVLEQSPGVVLDEKNISVNGKSGVSIMVNGKIVNIPSDMIISYLKGLNASNVEKIELIHSPDASYDAAGAGGMINVELKKGSKEGVFGTGTSTVGYNWQPKYSWSGSLNVSKKNLMLSAQYSDNKNFTNSHWVNDFQYNIDSDYYQNNSDIVRDDNLRDASASLQVEYDLGKGNRVGANGFWIIRKHWYSHSIMDHQYLNGVLQRQVGTQTRELNFWKRRGVNLNYTHTFKNQGVLSMDADRLFFHHTMPTHYKFTTFDQSTSVMEEAKSLKTTSPFLIDAYKLNYSTKLSDKLNMTFGGKYVRCRFDNEFELIWNEMGTWETDTTISNYYTYNEKIPAVFASFQLKGNNGNTFNWGLRFESTTMVLELKQGQLKRQFNNFFPNFSWSKKVDKSTYSINFNRRINRPGYNDLAPFSVLLGPNIFLRGNENLLPSLYNTVRVGYSNSIFNVSTSANYVKNMISNFQLNVEPINNSLIISPQNMNYGGNVIFTIGMPLKVTSWWEIQFSISGLYEYTQVNNNITSQLEQQEIWSGRFNTSQVFQLPYKFKMEVSGYYNSASLVGNARHLSYGSLNMGISKTISKNTLTLNISDILWTYRFARVTTIPQHNMVLLLDYYTEPRVVMFTYSRKFGNNNVNKTKKRFTASSEEQKR